MNCAADAWSVTVSRLEDPLSERLAERMLRRCYASRGGVHIESLTVRVLDKPTVQTLVVSWCDARFGRHGYEIWRTGVTQKGGAA
ncbi:protein of unknown function [Caballeronia sp. S22]